MMVIVGGCDILLSPIDRPSKHKLNRKVLKLANVKNQMDLTDVYRTFHQSTKE